MPDLHLVFLSAAVFLVLLALLYVYRGVKGPTVFDRVISLSGIATKTILLMTLIGSLYGQLDMVIDIAIGAALLNFIAALATAKYFDRGDPGE